MHDLTFIFPVRIDSEQRKKNLNNNVSYINKNFNTNVLILENDFTQKINNSVFQKAENTFWHKTKILNDAVRLAKTEMVALIDVDLFFDVQAYISAYNKIKNNEFDFVFSYSGECLGYNSLLGDIIGTSGKINETIVNNYYLEQMNLNAVGGSIFCKKKTYFEMGGQNENFISWGFEDNEFIHRIKVLEKTLHRENYRAYHINHPRTENSSDRNPNLENNRIHYNRICSMNKQELLEEIEEWPWKKQ